MVRAHSGSGGTWSPLLKSLAYLASLARAHRRRFLWGDLDHYLNNDVKLMIEFLSTDGVATTEIMHGKLLNRPN